MEEIAEVINEDEHILWQGRPALLPFFASTLVSLVLGFSVLEAIARTIAPVARLGQAQHAANEVLFLAPFILGGFILAVVLPLYRILLYWSISYGITDKRVVLRRGIIAKDVEMVDFDQIANASVDVGYSDVFLGLARTGSVTLATSVTSASDESNCSQCSYVLSHIPYPYAVFKLFERAEFDVKTDIDYPNQFRAETNPGYTTTYPPSIS